PAKFLTRLNPEYPRELWLQEIEGRVYVNVTVRMDGRTQDVQVHKSSGYPAMDRAAVAALQLCVLTPAKRGGKPIEKRLRVPIDFKIRR
ncbi:MAG: energy transducer TonB, partial [Planctomycetales bacterium]